MDTMAAKAIRTHDRCSCAVVVSPNEVDAGTDLALTCRVVCPEGCDLTGQRVSIRDQDDTELASAELKAFDGEACFSDPIALRAPLAIGAHSYRAVLVAEERNGVLHQAPAAMAAFTATAHTTTVNVWGLPSVIAAGERFSLTVGIKCSAGCKLRGRPFGLEDEEGARVGAGCLGDDVWPDTTALYFATLELEAPRETGDHQWQIQMPAADIHAAGVGAVAIKVVSAPDHEVTVVAVDGKTQAAIAGIHVLMHPYRAFTDARGVATLRVVKGRYTLAVSGFRYVPYEDVIDVASDVETQAILAVEPDEDVDYR
jgi:hypothetical protein